MCQAESVAAMGGNVNLLCVPTHARITVNVHINEWHSTHRAPPGYRIAFLLERFTGHWDDLASHEVLGVSTWGRPVARAEDQVTTLEHTRMALSPAAPKNSASWFIAANRRWIRTHMPEIHRLISYVDESHHTGVTYRADNWQVVYRRRRSSHTWGNRSGRSGEKADLRTKFERVP